MVPTRQTTTHHPSRPVAVVVPSLIVWSLTPVVLSWWPPPPGRPRGLPGVVEAFYTPRVTFLILAGLTLVFGWSARGDRERMWNVIGASVALTTVYFFLLK